MNRKAQQQFFEPLILVFIFVVFILALFFDGKGINFVTDTFTKIFISLIYSVVAGAFVGLIPVSWINVFNMNIFGIRFNLAAIILTFIIKMWLI